MSFIIRRAFCPHCDSKTKQTCRGQYVYHPSYEEMENDSLPEAYIFYSCDNCGGFLLYDIPDLVMLITEIEEESGLGYDDLEELLGDARVQKSLNLIWPITPRLPESTPQEVKNNYREALRIKKSSLNGFAVLIGRALEHMCLDMGASKGMIGSKLSQLASSGTLPKDIVEIAREITKIRNTAAHADRGSVSFEQAKAIEEFFGFLVNYVYVVRPKLSTYRDILTMGTNASGDEDEVVH